MSLDLGGDLGSNSCGSLCQQSDPRIAALALHQDRIIRASGYAISTMSQSRIFCHLSLMGLMHQRWNDTICYKKGTVQTCSDAQTWEKYSHMYYFSVTPYLLMVPFFLVNIPSTKKVLIKHTVEIYL